MYRNRIEAPCESIFLASGDIRYLDRRILQTIDLWVSHTINFGSRGQLKGFVGLIKYYRLKSS